MNTIYFIAPTRDAFGWRVVKTTAAKTHPKTWQGPFTSETAAQAAALEAHQTADPHCTCNDCLTELDQEEDNEPNEPEEGDLTTEDHVSFYQHGDLVLVRDGRPFMDLKDEWFFYPRGKRHGTSVLLGTFADDYAAAVRAYMDRVQYWPAVWFISDHGNAHQLTIHNKETEQ